MLLLFSIFLIVWALQHGGRRHQVEPVAPVPVPPRDVGRRVLLAVLGHRADLGMQQEHLDGLVRVLAEGGQVERGLAAVRSLVDVGTPIQQNLDALGCVPPAS